MTGIDPFEKNITFASACQRVFKKNFLQLNTIALIPHHGYKPEQNQSVKALQWLKYISYTEGHRIQHFRNGGVKKLDNYLVDGYYETDNGQKVVLEFNGDFWHGNPENFGRDTDNLVNHMTMGDLHDRTLEKRKCLEELGYTYRCILEAEFDRQCQENPDLKSFINELEIVTPLEPRDAVYGGRTLYKEAPSEEDIDYYDVTFLYPWVNKTWKIPKGHPDIVTEYFTDIEHYEGLVKSKVLPPRGLFLPVFPCKMNGKLLFHLCMTCAEAQQQTPCTHMEEERAFVGTWVTDEVKKAVQIGYRVLKLYEVWHFNDISRYDPETMIGGCSQSMSTRSWSLNRKLAGSQTG